MLRRLFDRLTGRDRLQALATQAQEDARYHAKHAQALVNENAGLFARLSLNARWLRESQEREQRLLQEANDTAKALDKMLAQGRMGLDHLPDSMQDRVRARRQ